MSSPVRTVIGHGRILAHPNLPVETLSSSVPIGTGAGAGSFSRSATFFPGTDVRSAREGYERAFTRRRWRATRSRLPQTSLEHQRRRSPREVSR